MLHERNHNQNQQHQKQEVKMDVTNIAYQNFINSLKSQNTRAVYTRMFKKLS